MGVFMRNELPYYELHRPQFHFSPRTNWTNDPNGLVYYKGEYHLFYQLNAQGVRFGPNTWGHAISPDLVHWKQLAHAIEPDAYGWIWSGSASASSDGPIRRSYRKSPIAMTGAAAGPSTMATPFWRIFAQRTGTPR